METTLSNTKKNSVAALFVKAILMFMIVYKSTPITGMTFITSERVAALMLVLFTIILGGGALKWDKKSLTNHMWLKMLFFQVFLFFYSVVLLAVFGRGTGLTITEDIINFLLFANIAYYTLTQVIQSEEELMRILLIISLVQGIIILLGLMNDSIASMIDNCVFNQNGVYWSYTEYREKGYPGGIACVAAKGVLQLSLGSIASYYFLQRSPHKMFYGCCFAVISVAMIAVARTGLIVTGVVFVFAVIALLRTKKGVVAISVFFVLIVCGLGVLLLSVGPEKLLSSFSINFARVVDLMNRGLYNSFLKYYFYGGTTVIPPLSFNTIIGTGITSGTAGSGVVVNADGAFLRMYTAVGLPLAIVFYVVVFGQMNLLRKALSEQSLRNVALVFMIVMLIGEFKEYYFYSRYMIVIYFAYAYHAEERKGTKRLELC